MRGRGRGLAVPGPGVLVPLIEIVPLGTPLTLAGVVLNLARLTEWFEWADECMCCSVEGNDVFVTCFVKDGSEIVEFDI